jgi:hypothetical protein
MRPVNHRKSVYLRRYIDTIIERNIAILKLLIHQSFEPLRILVLQTAQRAFSCPIIQPI